jgi:hypothetical protein
MSADDLSIDERRLETRIDRHDKVFVEVVSAPPGELEQSQVMACKTLDVSANGVQVEVSQPLVVGSILPLCVESAQGGERFYLSAEVRWVRPGSGAGLYQIGFLLYESEQTSIAEWKYTVAGLLDQDEA